MPNKSYNEFLKLGADLVFLMCILQSFVFCHCITCKSIFGKMLSIISFPFNVEFVLEDWCCEGVYTVILTDLGSLTHF